MFKIIGATVVYGFAIYGFIVWAKKHNQVNETPKGEQRREEKQTNLGGAEES